MLSLASAASASICVDTGECGCCGGSCDGGGDVGGGGVWRGGDGDGDVWSCSFSSVLERDPVCILESLCPHVRQTRPTEYEPNSRVFFVMCSILIRSIFEHFEYLHNHVRCSGNMDSGKKST